MSIVKRLEEHEARLVLIEEICIDKGALAFDDETNEIYSAESNEADKLAYVAVFQAWAAGDIQGTAAQIFGATSSILED
jgi:hypothetical protein